jgi:hypothetical protein
MLIIVYSAAIFIFFYMRKILKNWFMSIYFRKKFITIHHSNEK